MAQPSRPVAQLFAVTVLTALCAAAPAARADVCRHNPPCDPDRFHREAEHARQQLERADYEFHQAQLAAAEADRAFFAYSQRVAQLTDVINDQARIADDLRRNLDQIDAEVRRTARDAERFDAEAQARQRAFEGAQVAHQKAKDALDAAVEQAVEAFEQTEAFVAADQRARQAGDALRQAEEAVIARLAQTDAHRKALAAVEESERRVKELRASAAGSKELAEVSQRWIEAKNALGKLEEEALEASPEVRAADMALAEAVDAVEALRKEFFEQQLPKNPVVAAAQAQLDAEAQQIAVADAALQGAEQDADNAQREYNRLAADADRAQRGLRDVENAIRAAEADRRQAEIIAHQADFDRRHVHGRIAHARQLHEVALLHLRQAKEREDRACKIVVVHKGPHDHRDRHDGRDHRDGHDRPGRPTTAPTAPPTGGGREGGFQLGPPVRPGQIAGPHNWPRPRPSPFTGEGRQAAVDPRTAAERQTNQLREQAEAQRRDQAGREGQRRGELADAEREAARQLVEQREEAERQRRLADQATRRDARQREAVTLQAPGRPRGQIDAAALVTQRLQEQANRRREQAEAEARRQQEQSQKAAEQAAQQAAERQRQTERAAQRDARRDDTRQQAQDQRQGRAQQEAQERAERQQREQAQREARDGASQEAARQRAERSAAERAQRDASQNQREAAQAAQQAERRQRDAQERTEQQQQQQQQQQRAAADRAAQRDAERDAARQRMDDQRRQAESQRDRGSSSGSSSDFGSRRR